MTFPAATPSAPALSASCSLSQLEGELLNLDAKHPDAAIRLADLLIARALGLRASDVHLHPRPEGLRIRLRIDGCLHPLPDASRPPLISPVLGELLITRLKVMAKLVVFQRHLPQDGRILWAPSALPDGAPLAKTAQPPGTATSPAAASSQGAASLPTAASEGVSIRISFLPTLHGENAVLRFPESAARTLALEDLGLEDEGLRSLRALLELEQGVVLLTGPSSSGKTTTIYAMLRALHERRGLSSHILTLEDPIEQDLPFAVQVPIRSDQGLDWAAALRSVLRQDPNVIMIGEIRDRETAAIAIQAGLTGHLIISTLHCGQAAGVPVRLIQMGLEPYMAASALTAAIGQRLVRRLCPSCRQPVRPAEGARRRFQLAPDATLWTAPGCAACAGTGSAGRIGLYEILPVTPEVRDLMLARAPQAEIQRAGLADSFSMLAAARRHALAGRIALSELERIAAASLSPGAADEITA